MDSEVTSLHGQSRIGESTFDTVYDSRLRLVLQGVDLLRLLGRGCASSWDPSSCGGSSGGDAPPHGTPARPKVIGCKRKSVLGCGLDSLSAAPSARRTHSLGHPRPRRLEVGKLTTKAASHGLPPFCGQRTMPLSSAVLRPPSFVLLVPPVLLVPRDEPTAPNRSHVDKARNVGKRPRCRERSRTLARHGRQALSACSESHPQLSILIFSNKTAAENGKIRSMKLRSEESFD